MVLIILCLALISPIFAGKYRADGLDKSTTNWGVDVSVTITPDAATCLKNSGISYAVPRGYRSIGEVDTQVCTSLNNAYNAKIEVRDVYLFPCPTCSTKTPLQQMTELVDYLSANCKSVWSGRVWLDIEESQYWLGDFTKNENFYKGLVDSCSTLNIVCGIYSSKHQWETLFGDDNFVYGNNLPLWYAHYENTPNPSFSDWVPFGGWSTPYAKQYTGTATVCGISVDQDYAPSF